jgi:hypothetical protein
VTEPEFAALRQTIATRGTIRIVIAPATVFAWASVTLVLTLFSDLPVAALLSLAVLAGGFEAIHALHVGVERIGRYLQVFYEEAGGQGPATPPLWETTAMQVGPALPGGGVDPLFTALFLCATVLNLIPALLPAPTPLEIGVVSALHLAFIVRIMRARVAAKRQRAAELDRYRLLKSQISGRQSQPPSQPVSHA